MRALRHGGAMGHTTVVAAPAGAPLGERFAALSAAAALGERIRDAGGHALVVLDDISCMVFPQPRSDAPGCPGRRLPHDDLQSCPKTGLFLEVLDAVSCMAPQAFASYCAPSLSVGRGCSAG